MPVTTTAEWRSKRDEGIELLLPEYDDVVRIRPMDPEFFFQSGKLPDFLTPVVQRLINGQDRDLPIPKDQEPEDLKNWLAWLNDLVTYALVYPKVVTNPGKEGELAITEIGYADKLHIYAMFGLPARTLRSFREKQVQSVATVDVTENNGANAEQSAKDQSVGESPIGDA